MTSKSIVFSTLGIGIVGALAAGGIFFMSPSNIGELLQSEGTKLLDLKGDQEEWKKLVEKHKGTEVAVGNSNSEKIETISELNDITSDDKGVKKLKEKCKDLLRKSIDKGDQYEKNKKIAKNWCTKSSPLLKL